MKRKPEILAPAGNFDSLVAAVLCGANAVYLGGKSLNARRGAGNFDREELEQAVRYCHLRGVKVYQTINIVMFENEVEDAVEAIKTAAELGVDAILTQDMGVARIAQECAPELSLHASTQMSIHNVEGALEAQRLGFKRVVLARELTADEIAAITKAVDIETEVFVHGALCMSVSGQCYLSSMIGERSGNRGLCAQPCRLPFKAKGGDEYALSLKDLSLVDRVRELTRMGVASLKIEGRMKRPEYVAAATTALKSAIAGEFVDFDTLRSVFSRSGFTRGYFDNSIDKSMFGHRQRDDVVSAQKVLGELARLYDREQPLIPLDMRFTAKSGDPIALEAWDDEGHRATATAQPPQEALNRPTDEQRAVQNLSKTGGTPFFVRSIECDIAQGLMIPASELNAVRREVIEKICDQRSALHPYTFEDRVLRDHPKLMNIKIPTMRARINSQQLTDYIAQQCDKLIMPISDLPNVIARGITSTDKLVAEIPRVLFDGTDKLLSQLISLRKLGVESAWCGNLGAVQMARSAGMKPLGGYSLNITNSHALKQYSEMGLADTELSFEISLAGAKSLGDYLPQGILAYGYLPLMALRNCPIKAAVGCAKCRGYETLTDRKNIRFMVDCGASRGKRAQISELYNSVPLYLADRVQELQGLSFYTLYFTCEDRDTCEQVTRAYAEGKPAEADRRGRTRGLYYRNVL